MLETIITEEWVEKQITNLNLRIKSGLYHLGKYDDDGINLFFLARKAKSEEVAVSPTFNTIEEMNAYIEGMLHREFV